MKEMNENYFQEILPVNKLILVFVFDTPLLGTLV